LQNITSPNPDFSSLHVRNQTVYGLHQFESPSPAAFYSVEYTQNASTGALSPKKFTPVDFSAWGGLWVPCAGSMTPWGTHAGGEEYEPDGKSSISDSRDVFIAVAAKVRICSSETLQSVIFLDLGSHYLLTGGRCYMMHYM
jgi:hypothetical protein